MKKTLFLISSVIVLSACTPKTTETTDVKSSEFPSQDIASGNQLYKDYCGKCHEHKVVTDYTHEQWKKIVPNMAKKSKLDSIQESKVLQYVLWVSEAK